jgi:uncharacterized protein YggT (Ycf19 family)
MFSIIFGLIHGLLNVYKLLVIAYCVISLMGISANKWTELLRSVVEPLLLPIRKLLAQYLPKAWQIIDWSPVVLIILVSLVQWIL